MCFFWDPKNPNNAKKMGILVGLGDEKKNLALRTSHWKKLHWLALLVDPGVIPGGTANPQAEGC